MIFVKCLIFLIFYKKFYGFSVVPCVLFVVSDLPKNNADLMPLILNIQSWLKQ